MSDLSKKDSDPSVATLLHGLRAFFGLAALAKIWATFDPASFALHVLPVAKLSAAGGLGIGMWWWLQRRHPVTPTHEDWACGHYVTGKPGSGKTAHAYLLVREFCRQDWGWIWLSIKPSIRRDPAEPPRLPDYLPEEARERAILFAPYSSHPLGINFLKCYTGTTQERELLADQTAELFDRLHGQMSGNMRELIRMGTLALLIWAYREDATVTLWELYRLFQGTAFREQVLAAAPKTIRDAFAEAEPQGRNGQRKPNETLLAVRRQLRRAVSAEGLLLALAQPNGIDLWQVIQEGRWLVCDTPQTVLGPSVAAFLCRVIASRVQLLTDRRSAGSKPFGVFCDEVQRYCSSTFALGIETAREFGVCWFLLHQSENGQELAKDVRGAVAMCGSRYYFTQTLQDAKDASEAVGKRWTPEEFAFLDKRHFKGYRRLHGRTVLMEGVTTDLPEPDPDVAAEIVRRASAGPSREKILAEIEYRKVGGHHAEVGEGADDAYGDRPQATAGPV